MKNRILFATVALLTALAQHPAWAEVRSYTLGLDVNCPSGLGG